MKDPQKLAFCLYMAEQENRFPEQRRASIDACVHDFRVMKEKGYNPNDFISQVLALHNLKECQLSQSEVNYINRAVDAL